MHFWSANLTCVMQPNCFQCGTSVSQMVANYFQALTAEEAASVDTDANWKQNLPPITRSLVGSLA